MRLLSKIMLGVAVTVVLGLGALALTARSAASGQGGEGEGDPIIVKGGSLTIQCPKNDDCLAFNSSTRKHEHKEKNKKIQRIIVRDENGYVVINLSKVNFPTGKPTIEIYFK